jgi:hypothetical protein
MTTRTLEEQRGRALRTDGPNPSAMGFVDEMGVVRAVTGDGDMPSFMVPPQLFVPQDYRTRRVDDGGSEDNPLQVFNGLTGGALGDIATYLPAIDVRDARAVTFFMRYYPGWDEVTQGVSCLTIIAEAALPPPEFMTKQVSASYASSLDWYPIGVVDPTIRGVAPSVDGYTSVIPPTIGYRDLYASQFNFYATVQPAPYDLGKVYIPQITLPFDVAPYALFRLRVGVSNPDASVTTPPFDFVVPTNANLDIKYLASR